MIPRLQRWIDRAEGGREVLTTDLADWYGGPLLLPEPSERAVVVGNFVQSLDGVVGARRVLDSHSPHPPQEPLFGDLDDRMLMSILRAWSDVVVIGRNTLDAGSKRATWHWKTTAPKQPRALSQLESLDRALARPRPHYHMIVSGSGDGLDFGRAVFHDSDIQAVVLTTRAGAKRVRAVSSAVTPPPRVEVWDEEAADGGIDFSAALARLAGLGRRRVLVEGGPSVYGALESRGLVDELFLTTRGVVGGAGSAVLPSFSGHSYSPEQRPQLDLVSLRTNADSVLFSRWRYRR